MQMRVIFVKLDTTLCGHEKNKSLTHPLTMGEKCCFSPTSLLVSVHFEGIWRVLKYEMSTLMLTHKIRGRQEKEIIMKNGKSP